MMPVPVTVNQTTLLPNAVITSHASLSGCPVSEENAERVMLDPTSRDNLKFKDLLKVQWDHTIKENIRDADDQNVRFQVLIDWINSELEEERIIVKDLEEDCYDGQVLQKLFGEKQPFGTRMKLTTSLWGFLWTLLWSHLQFLIPSFPFVTEKLSGRKLNVAEVTQSEIGQKQKLQTVLEAVNELLRPHGWPIEWSVDCECWVLKPIRQQHMIE